MIHSFQEELDLVETDSLELEETDVDSEVDSD